MCCVGRMIKKPICEARGLSSIPVDRRIGCVKSRFSPSREETLVPYSQPRLPIRDRIPNRD